MPGLFLLELLEISCAPWHIVLQKELSIHQIFYLLNKHIQKFFKEIFLSIKRITLKNFTQQNTFIEIVPKHCFDVILANFE